MLRPVIHKAFILGAGLGTRLRPLTDVRPKPLVPIFHEPMANYALRHCQSAGIKEFAINTHHLPEVWKKCYPTATFGNSPLHFFHEHLLLETGGGLRNIASYIGDDPLLVYNGDILTNINIAELITRHEASGNIATLALRSSGENCNVNIFGDQISDIRNLLGNTPGTHQFTGIYCIQPEIVSMIAPDQAVSIIPTFIQLITEGKLGAAVLDSGDWFDIGNPKAYHAVHSYLRQNRNDAIHPDASIHPDAIVDTNSCIIGPRAYIAAGASLRNTIVWPDATVAENSTHNSEIITSS